jgi:uncharacterized protein (TIGR02466 family)
MSPAKDPWIAASDVVPMFPTLVWKLQLARAIHAPLDERILGALARMRADRPSLARGEGWQSPQGLHTREEFTELAACVLRAGAAVLRFLQISYDALEITGSWATVLAPGASHRAHSHPNNFLSAVYYVRVQEGADRINFHDPRAQTYVIRPPVTALTAENTDQVVVKVENGLLLLFPAYLQHSVDANESAAERVSLSFNLMFSGFTENLAKPLW